MCVGMTYRDHAAAFAADGHGAWSVAPWAGRVGRGPQVQPGTLPEGAQLSGVLPLTVLTSVVTRPELT